MSIGAVAYFKGNTHILKTWNDKYLFFHCGKKSTELNTVFKYNCKNVLEYPPCDKCRDINIKGEYRPIRNIINKIRYKAKMILKIILE